MKIFCSDGAEQCNWFWYNHWHKWHRSKRDSQHTRIWLKSTSLFKTFFPTGRQRSWNKPWNKGFCFKGFVDLIYLLDLDLSVMMSWAGCARSKTNVAVHPCFCFSVALHQQRLYRLLGTSPPRRATSSFTQLLNSLHPCCTHHLFISGMEAVHSCCPRNKLKDASQELCE